MKLTGVNKIIIFRALQLGDMLCSIPAIRSLRHTYPGAEITLCSLPWAKQLIVRFPHYFDSYVAFPGYPGLPEQTFNTSAFPEFITSIQKTRYDLALQMHGSGLLTNAIVTLFEAKNTAGFYTGNNYKTNNDLFVPYPHNLHEVERHLTLMRHLGMKNVSAEMEFPLLPADEQALQAAMPGVQSIPYVVIHPGARSVDRQWGPANFAVVADLCKQKGFEVIITGTESEMDIVNKVQQHMKYKPIVAAGQTSLGAVAALLKHAVALVSNCTGVSHIAAALQTKSIVISLDGEPWRWGPLNKSLHSTFDWTQQQDIEAVKTRMVELLAYNP